MLVTVSTVGSGRVKPAVYFKPTAQPISNKPARIRTSQAIADPPTVYGRAVPTGVEQASEVVLAAPVS
jgi:hypothetical protein